MDVRRVALIYDDAHRPETTGGYCRRALAGLAGVEHVPPSRLAEAARSGFDLYLAVDDGLDYALPPGLRPLAWWAIDTHLDYARCAARARGADLAFAAQRDGAARLASESIAATWLPLACDPEVHRKHDVDKRYDFAFVGNVFPGPRQDLLGVLRQRYRGHFVGNAYFDAMAEAYSAARLAFNRSLRGDVNMRVFEALACGTLLLTDDLADNGLPELFRDGVHLSTYRGAEDLLDKAAFYLARQPLRERIAAAGMAEAVAKHTYRHRMEAILRAAEAGLSSTSVRPGVALPDGTGDLSYFSHARPELLALIPASARRVLDVGCGVGRLGEAIKARQGAEVVGIELDPAAAAAAQARLDRVIVGDVERIDPGFAPGEFDCVVCGDVIEHLEDPDAFLRRVRDWLAPEGVLVASLPNVRHHTVVASLLAGDWTYEPAGLLDETHLAFFTRRDLLAMLGRCGFGPAGIAVVPGPGHREWIERGQPGEVEAGGLRIAGLTPEEAEEFFAYQFLVVASPRGPADAGAGPTSIVIRTWNGLEHTRRCVASVREATDEPYELIFVDNGSTDGTVEYLRSLPGAVVVENPANRGIPAAANQGIRAARGRHVLLLDNDAVVTRGWLGRLLATFERDPAAGLAGPCTNWPEGDQGVETGYKDLAGLARFAEERAGAFRGRAREAAELNGFCLLIRRELIDRIGPFDESFGLGLCEDKDYCRRSAEAGYRNLIVEDAYVHHEGSRAFLENGVDLAGQFADSRRRFREKWARPETAAVPAGERSDAAPAASHASRSGRLGGGRALRIAFLGNFEQAWSTEGYAADALERVGHSVHRIHEYAAADADEVLGEVALSGADCLVFFKGRIGVDPRDAAAVLRPDPAELVEVLRRSPVPAYLWYFDRVHDYDAEPSRLAWMRRVAPLCRLAFVTDGGLAGTGWAPWRVLRQGFDRPSYEAVEVPEAGRDDLAFVGQVYGDREAELDAIRRDFPVRVISDAFGRALSAAVRRHRIILGPRYPSAPGYWSDRLYVVLGHGGFFLAPEVPGMSEEGFEPGVHYAALGDDPARDIRRWLARPEERERIARRGRELVLSRFTYEDRVRELAAAIAETDAAPPDGRLTKGRPTVAIGIARGEADPAPA